MPQLGEDLEPPSGVITSDPFREFQRNRLIAAAVKEQHRASDAVKQAAETNRTGQQREGGTCRLGEGLRPSVPAARFGLLGIGGSGVLVAVMVITLGTDQALAQESRSRRSFRPLW